jgi:glycosyltransferase involved in cell wall biosynthesis
MNILMTLANAFTHDPRVYNEAKSLVNNGHSVTVLAWDKTGKQPIYETKDDISIVRSYNSKFMTLLPYDIFRLHCWWKKGYKDALKLFEKNHFDVVHCHDLSSLPIGVKIKKRFGIPLIYDAHEIWGFMIKKDLAWWKYYIHLEKKLLQNVNHVITVAEPHKEWFNKMNYSKVTLVRNCKRIVKNTYSPSSNNNFTITYIGGLNKVRFITEAIEVCSTLDGIYLKIAGFGVIEDTVKKLSASISNVEFVGKIPMNKVLSETCSSDVVLCVLDPSQPNNQVGPPNKIFEAMVCGRPVIATKGIYSGNLVEKLDMGLTINYCKKDLKNAIIRLRDDKKLRERLGRNALKAAIREYTWDNQERNLLQVYNELNNK